MLNIRKKDIFAVKLTLLAMLALIFSMGNKLHSLETSSHPDTNISAVASKDTSASHTRLTGQSSTKIQIGSNQDSESKSHDSKKSQIAKTSRIWDTFTQIRNVSKIYQNRCYVSKSQTGTSYIHQGQSPPIS